jgi:hypothetical protein
MTKDSDFPIGKNSFDLLNYTPEERDYLMEKVYISIIKNVSGALNSSSTRTEKIEALLFIISWFEAKEQYEKCNELKKIIEKI